MQYNRPLVDSFAFATQLALHYHEAGRPGLLSEEDFRGLLTLKSWGWELYNNSIGITHLGTADGDHIRIDNEGIHISGPFIERHT